MSQHEQAFFADVPSDVSRVALHALTVIVSGQNGARSDDLPRRTPPKLLPLDALNKRLYDAAISVDRNQVWAAVKEMQASGLSNQAIKVGSVTAIARQLGEDWVNDTATFAAVTIGCARLQAVVRHLKGTPPQTKLVAHEAQMRCLIAVPEGNQHTLGAILVTDQLRFAGATAQLSLGTNAAKMARLVQSQDFDAVMISASQGEDINKLRTLVRSARCEGSQSKILIGGGILEHYSDLVISTGTDYVARNVREALDLCAPDRILD